jgi:sugar (pentulose or hexulose) kinase
MNDAVLGVDIGTTSTKAVLFDLSGTELAAAEQAYRLCTPQPGWVEQDAQELWEALLHVLGAITDECGGSHRILALALAAQSGSLLPARQDGMPLGHIITWLDGRSEALVQRWRAEGLGVKVRSISGWHLHPGLCLPTIAWLRQHEPALFAATGRFLSVNDFLVQRLTGRFCTNPSNACGMELVDITSGQWSQELCALAGISSDQLSPVRPSGVVIGRISAEASRLSGLPAETLVVNGGHDQGCTALGLGVTAPGKVLLSCGTSWVVTAVVQTPAVASMPEGLSMQFHPAPGRWTVSQSLGGLGASLEWLLEHFWPALGSLSSSERSAVFAALNAELAETTPGSSGLIFVPPSGGHSAPAGDQYGALWGLRLDHGRADMARAVMEGAAYELRWALEPIRQAGMPIEQLRMVGGATQSPVWPGIVADVSGLPLSLPQSGNWPAVGAAILAGVGAGAFETMGAGQERFQRSEHRIDPDRARAAIYDERFVAYQQLTQLEMGGIRTT